MTKFSTLSSLCPPWSWVYLHHLLEGSSSVLDRMRSVQNPTQHLHTKELGKLTIDDMIISDFESIEKVVTKNVFPLPNTTLLLKLRSMPLAPTVKIHGA